MATATNIGLTWATGSVGLSNPTSINVEDNNYATYYLGGNTETFQKFNVSTSGIPTGAFIRGIEIKIKGMCNVPARSPLLQANFSDPQVALTGITYNSTNSWHSFGSPTDNLGLSKIEDINARQFYTHVQTNTGATGYVYFDQIVVTVYWDPDPDAPTLENLTLTWSNGAITTPANALVSDNVYATISNVTTPNFLYVRWNTDASSKIPATAEIVGWEVSVEWKSNTVAASPNISAGPGNNGGITWGINQVNVSTTDTVYVFGSASTNVGNVSLSNLSTISIRYSQKTSASTTHYLDFIGCKVYWKLPKDPSNIVYMLELC